MSLLTDLSIQWEVIVKHLLNFECHNYSFIEK